MCQGKNKPIKINLKNKKLLTYSLLFLIIAIGIFLRTYHIGTTPPGVYPDEAMNGEDAIHAAAGRWDWFYTNNGGREGLFMNLIAICFKLFGVSILTLKLPAIIAGILTIFGTYLLTRELFQKERIALIASFLTAVSFWAFNFSRISFRANLLPFILVFSFYFLLQGIRTKKFSDFAIGGFIFGIGLHTYIAFRIAPLLLLMLLVLFAVARKNFWKDYWKKIMVFFALALVSAASMLYTFYIHPDYFFGRIDTISIFSPEINKGNVFATLVKSFGLSMAQFNFWGDQNWRHNYPPYPILDPLVGIAFLFGMIYSVIKLTRLFTIRIIDKIRSDELMIYSFLIAWFFIMLAPEFMTGESLPHALRSIGTLPVVMIFAAITFEYFMKEAEKGSKFYKKIVIFFVILMLTSVLVFNSVKYFYFWAPNPTVAQSFDKNLTDISDYIQTLPPQEEKFIVNSFGPYHSPLDRLPIQIFNMDLPNTTYLYSWQNFDQIRPKTDDFIVILTGKDADTQSRVRERFPDLTLQEINTSPGSVYYIIKNKK